MNQISRNELMKWLNETLQPDSFRDYCPNGLQVEGRPEIRHIITGVTASRDLLQKAISRKADAILVHHGWFWKNEDPRLIGPKRERIALALEGGLNLIAYHLPLDAHPTLGNNAQLAQVLGLDPDRDETGRPKTCGPDGLVWLGRPTTPCTLADFAASLEKALNRKALVIGDAEMNLERVAWCTGGAQNYMQAGIDAGAQLFITGEASEPNYHLANETGTAFIAAGHHATERYGIKAVGEAIAEQFKIQVEFLDLNNPV